MEDSEDEDQLARYKLEDFLEMRSNKECYGIFFQRFLPCVTGKTLWNINLDSATKDSDLASVTDEAFCLLLLINSYDRWIHLYKTGLYKRNKHKVTMNRGNIDVSEDVSNVNNLDVETKFTYLKMKTEDRAIKQGTRGWSYEGIRTFNELTNKIKEDRKNRNFITRWLGGNRNIVTRKKAAKPKVPILLPKDDLFSSDEDNDEEDRCTVADEGPTQDFDIENSHNGEDGGGEIMKKVSKFVCSLQ